MTKAGQQLWRNMEASHREIYFHNVNSRDKSNTIEQKNLANFMTAGRADGWTMSNTEYANAQMGKVTDTKVRGTFIINKCIALNTSHVYHEINTLITASYLFVRICTRSEQ